MFCSILEYNLKYAKENNVVFKMPKATRGVEHTMRFARYLLVQHTKTRKKFLNNHNICMYTKWPPYGRKIDQMAIKYTNIFQ
jgi:hypothetical protein